jgi:nitrogen fixation/metabolism regulation signal transduction histidine kinase
LASRREAWIGGRLFTLFGGRELAQVVSAGVSPPAWVFEASLAVREPVAGADETATTAARVAAAALRGDPDRGERDTFAAVVLGSGPGPPSGVIVAAAGPAPGGEDRAGPWLGLGLLAAAVVAGAGAAGAWAGRRVGRPVRQLVRAVEAISAGEGYRFPRGRWDEFAELEAAFARMQRSLELQAHRSRAAERVAAWREAARQVAHEVKNPLVPIRLTVENLKRARRESSPLFDELFEEGSRTILEEVEQLRRLVGEFAEFARLPPPSPRRLPFESLVDEVLELYAADPEVRISRDFPRGESWVMADAEQMSRALKNVLGNAVEAMRGVERGPIEVTLRRDGDGLELSVRDHGAGLSPVARERVFEPYFTTKAGGTGLGMAITHRIVTEHGGTIAVEPAEGGGTRVVIRLPPAVPEAPRP